MPEAYWYFLITGLILTGVNIFGRSACGNSEALAAAATILDDVCLHRILADCTEEVFEDDIVHLKEMGVPFTPEAEAAYCADRKQVVERMIRKYVEYFARRHRRNAPQEAPIIHAFPITKTFNSDAG